MKKRMKRLVLTKETVRELGLAKVNGVYDTFTVDTCNLNNEVCMNMDTVEQPPSIGFFTLCC